MQSIKYLCCRKGSTAVAQFADERLKLLQAHHDARPNRLLGLRRSAAVQKSRIARSPLDYLDRHGVLLNAQRLRRARCGGRGVRVHEIVDT